MMKIRHTAAAQKSDNMHQKLWRLITEKGAFRIFTFYIWQVSSSTVLQEQKMAVKPEDKLTLGRSTRRNFWR